MVPLEQRPGARPGKKGRSTYLYESRVFFQLAISAFVRRGTYGRGRPACARLTTDDSPPE